jgi:outer membrane protein
MTTTIRTALAACAITFFAAAGAAQAPAKIAFVNSQKLLPQAPGFADAQQTIETETEGVKAQEQKMSDSLNSLVQAYQQVQGTLTAPQKASREASIRAKQQEFQGRATALEARATQHQADLVQPIMEQIRGVIEQMRIEGGFAAVFDAGSQAGVVVAMDTTLDITDKVIAKLKDAGPAKGLPKPSVPVTPVKPAPAPVAKPTGVSRPPTMRGV